MGYWFFNHLKKRGREQHGPFVGPFEEKQLTSGMLERLSSFSIIHPEHDALTPQIYCGRLFVRKDGYDATHQERVDIQFDGSCDDLDRKSIAFIAGAGYQYGYRVTIVLVELREPIPEAFSKAFDDF